MKHEDLKFARASWKGNAVCRRSRHVVRIYRTDSEDDSARLASDFIQVVYWVFL